MCLSQASHHIWLSCGSRHALNAVVMALATVYVDVCSWDSANPLPFLVRVYISEVGWRGVVGAPLPLLV